MLNENIKKLRKAKGLTQEELAIRLFVVRQTVSKWEKALSVPDSDMLIKMADYFEVSVSDLLGDNFDVQAHEGRRDIIAEHLSRINEQLAIKNERSRKIWKTIKWIVIGIVIFNLLLIILNFGASATMLKPVETMTEMAQIG